MFSIAHKSKKSPAVIPKANDVLHDWDREDTLQAIEQLSEAKDVHTLGELFALHRIMQKHKERKGVREEKADTRFLRQSVH
ncbi:MAG: hypothetical protein V7765_10905 [Oleispira sp.]